MHKAEKSVKRVVLRERKKFWFEKFHWFLSSEKYIVVSGASCLRLGRRSCVHGTLCTPSPGSNYISCESFSQFDSLPRTHLSGHDAQQNDQLVKRYMRKGDVYVHADLHGAASCIVRNRDASGVAPIPLKTLEEAGAATVCHSNAWKANIVTSAWWVFKSQVSKTAPSGECVISSSTVTLHFVRILLTTVRTCTL